MRRAFALASYGQGSVSPNPVVGCVVVWQDKVIGEGFHHRCGQAHAEVNAIDSVLAPDAVVARCTAETGKSPQELLRESTLYVTLEPCSHYGKQPPCAKKIIESGIPRVVMSCADPNPAVNGKGVRMLREAGVEVVEHFLEAEGRETGRRFFTNVEKKRPYVILKWAQTEDGFIAARKGTCTKITGAVLQVLNHSYRVQEDAIMVGTGTLLSDNPRLDARLVQGRQPLRVGFDLRGRLLRQVQDGNASAASALHFFDGTRESMLFVDEEKAPEYAGLQAVVGNNLQICALKSPFTLYDCLARLHVRQVGSVIVEGGTELLRSFLRQGLWDEARVFFSEKRLGGGYPAPELPAARRVSENRYGGERVVIYRNS